MTILSLGITELIIRPSSLPAWNDCARRQAARLFPRLIEAAGYTLRSPGRSVGAIVGTATHAGAAKTLEDKMKTGEIGQEVDALDASVESLTEEIKLGSVIWDETTRNKSTAEKQVLRMVKSYRTHLAPKISPIAVEERLKVDLGDGLILSGQSDTICREPGAIRDTKTGKQRSGNAAQYGGYGIIQRSHGRDIERVTEDFIQRVAENREQPAPVSLDYGLAACEHAAVEAISDIKQSVDEFGRRLSKMTPDEPPEYAFRANPMSVLCSEKYCSAFGTDFCRVHKEKT